MRQEGSGEEAALVVRTHLAREADLQATIEELRASPGGARDRRADAGRGRLMAHQWRGVITEYADRLPIADDFPIVTLREGGTPLIESGFLSERLGCRVLLKLEGANPTGSFKDRGMTMALSQAVADGAQAVICASTGNTSASAAAYAGRAGLDQRGAGAGGQDRHGQARPGHRARRPAAAGAGQLRRLPEPGPRAVRRATPSRW